MMRFVREFRLIPVVLLAITCLFGLKVLGIILDGGYTLGTSDFGSGSKSVVADADAALPQTAAKSDAVALKPPAKRYWEWDNFNVPDVTVTGSIDSDKPPEKKTEKAAEGGAAAPVKPADAKPAGGGTLITLDPNAVSSPSERAILERLGERRQELDARARELEIRENLLKSAEKRLDVRVDEIKGMESQLGGAAQQKKQADAARLKGLVTMYENMKAKDAAKIFDRLEMRVLIDVVTLINPRRMSDIMAQMQPEMAEKLTAPAAPSPRRRRSSCPRSRDGRNRGWGWRAAPETPRSPGFSS
jgi:flagellar motility protein MotE (MotC chaperone)